MLFPASLVNGNIGVFGDFVNVHFVQMCPHFLKSRHHLMRQFFGIRAEHCANDKVAGRTIQSVRELRGGVIHIAFKLVPRRAVAVQFFAGDGGEFRQNATLPNRNRNAFSGQSIDHCFAEIIDRPGITDRQKIDVAHEVVAVFVHAFRLNRQN